VTFDPRAEDLTQEIAAFDTTRADFDLLAAASLLSRTAGVEPRPDFIRSEVAALAMRVREHPESQAPWPGPLVALLEVMFGDDGFQGDREHYDDPDNSFLERVLERRRGLPIALSLLTREVGRAAGLVVDGIGFPGHFLVSVEHRAVPDEPLHEPSHEPSHAGAEASEDEPLLDMVVIDPFHRGRMLTPGELEELLERTYGSPTELLPEHLAPADDQAILVRMLVNLRGSFARRRDPVGMFRVLSRMLLLRPEHPEVLAERAVVRRDLLDLDGAREDAEAAVRLARSESAPAARRAQRVLRNLNLDRFSIH